MSSSGVPRLQLDSLGGRTTPRSATSRQAALQRVFKGLDDEDHLPPRPAAAPARGDASVAASNDSMRSSFSAGAAITPRASRDEIERRRKVMFDSEDEDTPSQPKRFTSKTEASPSLGPSRASDREPSRAKAPGPVSAFSANSPDKEDDPKAKPPKAAAAPAPAAQNYRAPSPRLGSWRHSEEKEDEPEAKPPKDSAAPAAQNFRAPSPRIGSWRQQSPGRSGRTPRAEVQRRQARQVNDDSDSDLDDIAVRGAREAMPSTSPLSLAPSMNGSKKPTYSRHASPSPASSPPLAPKAAPLPPIAPVAAITPAVAPAGAAFADEASTKQLIEMVAAMQTEIKALREQLAEQPTVGQFEKLQQQLRVQNTEMGNMRDMMDKMQQQINSMSGRANGVSSMKNEAVVVSAEVVPLHSVTGNKEPQEALSPASKGNMIQQEMMKNWIGEEIANRPTINTPRRTDAPISQQTSPVTKVANPTATRSVPPPPQAGAKASEAESANRPEADPKPDPSLINTPAPRVSRVSKSVVVIRQPIPGAQVTQTDKVGIGISFGMTAKGDVFITGMAPNGPAKASGQIKRGDQLLAVDDTEIKGWDVKDIVGLIVGPQDTQVRLNVASLPDGHPSSPGMMSPRAE